MNLDTPDLKYYLALNQFSKFGPVKWERLLDFFQTAQEVLKAPVADLIASGIDPDLAQEFSVFRNEIQADRLLADLAKENINVILKSEDAYPKLLKEIHDAPPLLYYKGRLPDPEEICLAVVGSRKASVYGKQVTEDLVDALAKNGLTIVSGLALGIDSLAHEIAVLADGRTIAVLGSGLDRQSIYPSSNRYLADKIISSGGLVLSEFPLGSPPLKHHFPLRNRIISGLSVGTLVIEAGLNSGSLITARAALEQNREVFAVPGQIYADSSTGTLSLIKQGAIVVTGADDILDALDLSSMTHYTHKEKVAPQNMVEGKLIDSLSFEPCHIDELVRKSGLNTAEASSALVLLEMRGAVKNLGGMRYVLAR